MDKKSFVKVCRGIWMTTGVALTIVASEVTDKLPFWKAVVTGTVGFAVAAYIFGFIVGMSDDEMLRFMAPGLVEDD